MNIDSETGQPFADGSGNRAAPVVFKRANSVGNPVSASVPLHELNRVSITVMRQLEEVKPKFAGMTDAQHAELIDAKVRAEAGTGQPSDTVNDHDAANEAMSQQAEAALAEKEAADRAAKAATLTPVWKPQ